MKNNKDVIVDDLVGFEDQPFVIKTYEILSEGFSQDRYMFDRKTVEPYEYVKKVNSYLIKIQHTIKTIQFSRVFLAERHPAIYDYINCNSSISIDEYLRYHIESYFLRLPVYKDQILQLINSVYKYNVKLGNGFEKRISKSATPETKDTIKDIIQAIDLLIEKVKPIRNKIAHEGYFHDNDLGMLSGGILYMSKDIEFQNEMESKTGYKFGKNNLDKILSETIMNNIKDMRYNETEIGTNLFWVLNLIYPEYKNQIEKLYNDKKK